MAQHLVAGGMTDAVVDGLEMVHVAHDDGERFLGLPRPQQLAVEVGLQLTVVGDPGHGIGRRQLLGALVGGRILHRDHRLVRQRLQHPDFAPLQRPWLLHVDGEDTDDLPCQAHGDGDRPLQPDPSRQRQRLAAVVQKIELQHLFGPHHARRRQVAALADRGQLAPGCGTDDDIGELLPPGRLAHVEGGIGNVEDLGGGMRHRAQQVVGSDRHRCQRLRDLLQRDNRLVEPV